MAASAPESADSKPEGENLNTQTEKIRFKVGFLKKEHDPVLMLVAIVLSAAIVLSISLFLSLWLMPPKVECTTKSTHTVDFDTLKQGGSSSSNITVTTRVADISCHLLHPLSSWKVTLSKDGNAVIWQAELKANTIINIGSTERLIVTDDGNGRLSIGDTLLVFGMEGYHDWWLELMLQGSILEVLRWTTPGLPTLQPTIEFSGVAADGSPPHNSTATWSVANSSDQTYEFPHYKAQLMRGSQGLTTTPQRLQANTSISLGSAVTLTVIDSDTNRNLTVGDRFLVCGLDGVYSWNLTLWWSSPEILIASARWSTSFTKPVITFGAVSKDGNPPLNHSASWAVTSTSTPLFDMGAYFVTIERDGIEHGWANFSAGVAVWLNLSMRLIVHSSGAEGKLDSGTTFLVYGMDEPHDWRFSLWWYADISEIQSILWSTP